MQSFAVWQCAKKRQTKLPEPPNSELNSGENSHPTFQKICFLGNSLIVLKKTHAFLDELFFVLKMAVVYSHHCHMAGDENDE